MFTFSKLYHLWFTNIINYTNWFLICCFSNNPFFKIYSLKISNICIWECSSNVCIFENVRLQSGYWIFFLLDDPSCASLMPFLYMKLCIHSLQKYNLSLFFTCKCTLSFSFEENIPATSHTNLWINESDSYVRFLPRFNYFCSKYFVMWGIRHTFGSMMDIVTTLIILVTFQSLQHQNSK